MSRTVCAIVLAATVPTATARADPAADTPPRGGVDPPSFRGELGVTPLLAAGLTPSIASGASFSASFRWPSVSAAVEARVLSSLGGTQAGGVLVGGTMAMPALTLCGHLSSLASLAACGVVDIGELRVDGGGGAAVAARDAWSTSVGLRAGGSWPFSEHLELHAFVEAHARLGRPSVWVNDAEAWRAPLAFVVVGVGLALPLSP